MFYLGQFFFIIKKFPVRALLFFLSSGLLMMGPIYGELLQEMMTGMKKIKKERPYFWLVIEGESDRVSLQKKISKLPGVMNMTFGDPEQLRKMMNEVNSVQKLDEENESLAHNESPVIYTAIKIEVMEQISLKNLNILREYIHRYVGKQRSSVGATKNYEEKVPKGFFAEMGPQTMIFSIIFLIWVLAFFIFSGVVSKYAKLVEHYQRRHFVEIKILLSGNVVIMSFFLLVALVMMAKGVESDELVLAKALVVLGSFFMLPFVRPKKMYAHKKN